MNLIPLGFDFVHSLNTVLFNVIKLFSAKVSTVASLSQGLKGYSLLHFHKAYMIRNVHSVAIYQKVVITDFSRHI